jgi:parallel beta-helix repeat protein
MMRLLILSLLGMALAASGTAWAEAPVYFIAANGNDAWTGKVPDPEAAGQDGPFATLARAREALRSHGSENGLPEGGTVYVRGGAYYLSETLVLGRTDSGTPDHPVIWQAFRMEPVRLLGGKRVEGFMPAEDQILQATLTGPSPYPSPGGRGNAKDQILQAALTGVTAPLGQLFFHGARQTLARWPNKNAEDMPGGGWAFVTASVDAERSRSFHYTGDRPAAWASAAGAQVSIWPNYNWWQTVADVESVDAANRLVRLTGDLSYTIEPGRRFFFQNVFEELDAPGEWFFNKDTGILYFWPPASMDNAEVVVPTLDSVVRIENAANINLIAFTIEAARGDGVVVTGSEACLVARCTVRNTGGFGVTVDGGKSVRVNGNDIFETGRGGIVLKGGDRKTLTPGNHQAVNNHIHDFGRLYQTYQTGVNVDGVANRVANNLIHDAPHIGILLGGNDHLIEYNDIHHVCLEGSDNGGFYMGRDWTQRGNVIRFNKFHDIYGFGLAGLAADASGVYNYEAPHQAWGIYLDDCSSGTTVFGNIFYRVPLCGVMIGGGRDNVVENNIFVECVPALHIDARWDAYCWDVMQERLEAMNYKEPPYSQRYPELLTMGADPRRPENNRFVRNVVVYSYDDFRGLSTTAPGSNPAVVYNLDQFDPASTVIDENLLYHFGKDLRVAWHAYKQEDQEVIAWDAWLNKGFDAKSFIADPVFTAPDIDDYWLHKDSAAIARLGFKQIPVERIGLYHDEFRASWPVAPDTRRDGVQQRRWAVTVTPEGAAVQYLQPQAPVQEAPKAEVSPEVLPPTGVTTQVITTPVSPEEPVFVNPELGPTP